MPPTLQHHLFRRWNEQLMSPAIEVGERTELLTTLASAYSLGFGCDKDVSMGRSLDLEAARNGLVTAQFKCITYGLIDGFDASVSEDEKLAWLQNMILQIFFQQTKRVIDVPARGRFEAGLKKIAEPATIPSLLLPVTRSYMAEWEVLQLAFDNAAEDELFANVIAGDVQGLRRLVDEDSTVLQRRKDGFTLLHVAVDYCQVNIIRGEHNHAIPQGNKYDETVL
jgi:hypothetical protein